VNPIQVIEKKALARVGLVDYLIHDDVREKLAETLPFHIQSLSKHSQRAFISDTARFMRWCAEKRFCAIPCSPFVLRQYIAESLYEKTPNTVKRHVSSINTAHVLVERTPPGNSKIVKSLVIDIADKHIDDEMQAQPLRMSVLEIAAIETDRKDLRQVRDIMVALVAHSTLLRASELCAIKIGDITFHSDGSGSLRVPKTKGKKGHHKTEYAYLTPLSAFWMKRWMKNLPRQDATTSLLQGITKHGTVRGNSTLQAQDVSDCLNRVGKCVDESYHFTGHSARVGAALDMAESGEEFTKIMQAGRWKSSSNLMRYLRKTAVKENGMASFYRKYNATHKHPSN
jgi:site-specific recombinase XerD